MAATCDRDAASVLHRRDLLIRLLLPLLVHRERLVERFAQGKRRGHAATQVRGLDHVDPDRGANRHQQVRGELDLDRAVVMAETGRTVEIDDRRPLGARARNGDRPLIGAGCFGVGHKRSLRLVERTKRPPSALRPALSRPNRRQTCHMTRIRGFARRPALV
ncbi:hypothetical protein E4K65_32090 [Bradyrhizobium niftali]|uniref:Uncharacterized protein n=1 Tax=Bradyrhizobium niftali TaxID=2560055 RepID=A0A4Y9LKP8_9BRAD|nr:hypothetical protein E4K65_32090 [Bradyrhizobium niftali]